MRLRSVVLASLSTALIAVLLPSLGIAAPARNRHLTINAVPHHIIAGDAALIYGRLRGSDVAGQTIRLLHRIPPQPGYTQVTRTVTDSQGYYEFVRPEGLVNTNRSWFVRGPAQTHSRTVYEIVSALVSLSVSKANPDTRHKVTFAGSVFPRHPFERVLLQARRTSDDWHTIARTLTGGDSSFRLHYGWRVPGVYEVRALLPADRRNATGSSDPITVTVQQAQVPGFSLTSSSPVIAYGQSATMSGALDKPQTTTPAPDTAVTLLAHGIGTNGWLAVANTTTADDGTYTFSEAPVRNTLYEVRVTANAKRHTAVLFEGVRDVVSAAVTPSNPPADSRVTFKGTVLPGQQGDVVYLQRLGKDGDWHTVRTGTLNNASAYSLPWTVGDAGTKTFRIRALGDHHNISGVSPALTVTITPAPPSQLPPAS